MIPPSRRWIAVALLLLACSPAVVLGQTTGQDLGPYRVLIPDFHALDGADRDFGEDAAEVLREFMAEMVTHRPIERDDVEDALDDFDIRMRDLDCPLTRQLALHMSANVALCAEYGEQADGRYAIQAVFVDLGSGEEFTVDPTVAAEHEDEAVAEHIFTAFDRYTTFVLAVANCEAFAASAQWDRALALCDRAIEINPEAVQARYRRARILVDSDDPARALPELERVLELDPVHEDALELAGYTAGLLGLRQEAVDYYSAYLRFDPENAGVRMRVAYDLAQAGDPRGAMQLVQQGLDLAPDQVDLNEQFGGYAFTVAEEMRRLEAGSNSGGVTPGAEALFRDAIAAYRKVYAARGQETAPRHLRSIAIAYLRIDQVGMAVSISAEAVDIHPDEATLWSVHADALRRSDHLGEALVALDRVQDIDPSYPNLGLRRGLWLVEAGRIVEAVDGLARVAEADPDLADQAAGIILGDAYATGVQEREWGYAIEALEAVRAVPNVSEPMAQQLTFWLGYSIFQDAIAIQAPRSLETARRTLPLFQRALELFRDVGDYPATVGIGPDELRTNVVTYIEIQEAIIRRGG